MRVRQPLLVTPRQLCAILERLFPNSGEKKPAHRLRGLESTEVVEETDFNIHDLLRRTKRLWLASGAKGIPLLSMRNRRRAKWCIAHI
jgi:hypothetical protein